jgi:hypothetical protein
MFKKKKKVHLEGKTKQIVPMKALDYPAKILVAWAKAIEGDTSFADWLRFNGYLELFTACSAIRLNAKAREWLMHNGYPHLLAFIQASESNKQAKLWLEKNNFNLLLQMAKGIDGEQESLDWVKKTQSVDIFILTMAIKKIKDEIEDFNNDPHNYK